MATLRLSIGTQIRFSSSAAPGLATFFVPNATTTAATMASYPNALMGGADTALPNRRFNIYQGAMPDFGTFTTATSRSSDLLIKFVTPVYTGTSSGGFIDSNTATGVRELAGIVSTPTTPLLSGVASWFLLSRSDDVSGGPAIIGTVGVVGSGADLEIPDVNIDATQTYRSGGFYFYLPTTLSLS